MKKIKKQSDTERIQKRNNLIMGVVMILLLTASTLGFALMSQEGTTDLSDQEYEYNGQTFVQYNGLWNIQGTNLLFQFIPSELTDVSIEGNYSLQDYSSKPLYFVNYRNEGDLILNNLDGQIARYQEACLDDCELDLPTKNCAVDNIIVFEYSSENETTVSKVDNCVYISGDLTRGVDAFNYKLVGMI